MKPQITTGTHGTTWVCPCGHMGATFSDVWTWQADAHGVDVTCPMCGQHTYIHDDDEMN